MKQIGIIGNGFVGGAVAYGFSNYEPRIYDIHPELSPNTLEEVLECDFVFIIITILPLSRSSGCIHRSFSRSSRPDTRSSAHSST